MDASFEEDLAGRVKDFVLRDAQVRPVRPRHEFGTHERWLRLREVGSDLWLDTGSLDDAAAIWTGEFTSLTTNNTLLNKEVQTGTYDQTIVEAARMLIDTGLDRRRLLLEIAFILNARHALKLVERFDAMVSVEEHTDLAHDVELSVAHGLRYRDISPERFYVKVPLTPAGLIATRRLSDQGVKVNHTLGFSARQNYLIARLARPLFVNVFLGRLNSFVAENRLGSGALVGERATLSSQQAIRALQQEHGLGTRQIAASLRDGGQVVSLAGVDVLTMPPKVAKEFLDLQIGPEQIADQTSSAYQPPLEQPERANVATLWEIDQSLADCCDELEGMIAGMTPDQLLDTFEQRGLGDLLVRWSDEDHATSRQEGKIPKLDRWGDRLASGQIGLDSLMNLAGLESFAADQAAMDQRVSRVLEEKAGLSAA